MGGAIASISSVQQGLLGTVAGGLVGFIAGVWVVDYRLARAVTAREERITEEFPTIIELLGLALAAGYSLPRALSRVSGRSRGELGQEWARVMSAVDLGAPLGQSLRDSAARVGGAQVIAFVEHLAQALDRGAPLGEVVSSHARDAKEQYTRVLVDKAGKAEVQMLVPMVLLILPITVIFAIYPGLQALQFGF
jgi:tight adherence protein C